MWKVWVRPGSAPPDSMGIERRVDPSSSVSRFKDALYPVLGIAPQYQLLQTSTGPVHASDDAQIDQVFCDGIDIVVDDINPYKSLANEGYVEKFTLDEQAYTARTDNFRKFRQNLEKQDPGGHFRKRKEKKQEAVGFLQASATKLAVGNRCEVIGGRRGVIQYVGNVAGRPSGPWVGIDLDEPIGTCDSSPFFTSKPNSALWIRPDQVQAGDFPEKDPFGDESDAEL